MRYIELHGLRSCECPEMRDAGFLRFLRGGSPYMFRGLRVFSRNSNQSRQASLIGVDVALVRVGKNSAFPLIDCSTLTFYVAVFPVCPSVPNLARKP